MKKILSTFMLGALLVTGVLFSNGQVNNAGGPGGNDHQPSVFNLGTDSSGFGLHGGGPGGNDHQPSVFGIH